MCVSGCVYPYDDDGADTGCEGDAHDDEDADDEDDDDDDDAEDDDDVDVDDDEDEDDDDADADEDEDDGDDYDYDDDDDEYDEEDEDMAGLSESDWALIGALERYSYQSASQTWPKVTLFAQQPFIYTNGIKKKNRCLGSASKNIGDHLEHAPMIRFGDSFTTGDGLNGAGLFTHAAMVGTFMDAILDKCMTFSSTRVS